MSSLPSMVILSLASFVAAVAPCRAATTKPAAERHAQPLHPKGPPAFVEIPDPDTQPAIVFEPNGGPALPAALVRPIRMPLVPVVRMPPGPVAVPASVMPLSAASVSVVRPQVAQTTAAPVVAAAQAMPPPLPAQAAPLSVTIAFDRDRAGGRAQAEAVAEALRARGLPVDQIQAGRVAGEPLIRFGFEEDRPSADQVGRILHAATGVSDPLRIAPDDPTARPGLITIALPG